MVEDQHDDRTHHRHDHAVDVEAGDPGRPELGEDEAADDGSNDAENDGDDDDLADPLPQVEMSR